MGLDFSKFEWTPNTIGKNWMSVCNYYGNMMPFIGQTLWQVGPMPFITQGWFPNTNYGNWGDQFVSSYTPGAGGGGSSTNLTESEKETLIKQKTEIKDYVKKYNNILKALNAYKGTLTGDALSKFESVIYTEGIDLSSEYKVDNINSDNNLKSIESKHTKAKGKYEAILKIYNNYNTNQVVENAYKEFISEEQKLAKTNNSEYDDEVTSVSNWISAPTDSLPLLEEDNGSYTWSDNIDIMDFLSTWNSTEGKDHLIKTIVTKYGGLQDEDPKRYLETFTEKLCGKLKDRAGGIDQKKLTDSTKKFLKGAINAFPSSIRSSNLNSELATKFDNLYKAVRLAEAEIADKELREAFDFLGNENPYKNNNDNKLFNEAKADLKSENVDVNDVTPPQANPTPGGNENPAPTPANTPAVDKSSWNNKKVKINNTECTVKVDSSGNVTFDHAQCTGNTESELGISDFKMEDDGSYSYTKDGRVFKFNANHKIIENDNDDSNTEQSYNINISGYDIKYSNGEITYKSSGIVIDKMDFERDSGITNLKFEADGGYSYTKDGETKRFDKNGNEIKK